MHEALYYRLQAAIDLFDPENTWKTYEMTSPQRDYLPIGQSIDRVESEIHAVAQTMNISYPEAIVAVIATLLDRVPDESEGYNANSF